MDFDFKDNEELLVLLRTYLAKARLAGYSEAKTAADLLEEQSKTVVYKDGHTTLEIRWKTHKTKL